MALLSDVRVDRVDGAEINRLSFSFSDVSAPRIDSNVLGLLDRNHSAPR